jgi:hypothetical protein
MANHKAKIENEMEASGEANSFPYRRFGTTPRSSLQRPAAPITLTSSKGLLDPPASPAHYAEVDRPRPHRYAKRCGQGRSLGRC